MRRVLIASFIFVAACANILGIDDGTPRSDDASLDTSSDDVAIIDAGARADVAVEAAFSPLHCGATDCNFAAGEGCCRTGSATYTCVDAATACSNGTYIPCDRPEQCAAGDAGPKECCTTDILTDGGTYVASTVSCLSAAQCTPIPTHYILCGDDSGADCPPEAGCAASVSTLPTFLICK